MNEDEYDDIYRNVDLDDPDGIFQVAGRMGTWGGREDYETGQDSGETASGVLTYDPETGEEPYTSGLAISSKWMKKNGGALNYGDEVEIINPANNKRKRVKIIDAGPSTYTGRAWDVRPRDAEELGLNTDDEMIVDFKPAIMGKSQLVQEAIDSPGAPRMVQAGRSAGTRSDVPENNQNALAGVRELPDGGFDLGDGVIGYPNGNFHVREGNRVTEWSQDESGNWKKGNPFTVQPKSNIYRDPDSGITYNISQGLDKAQPLDLPGNPAQVDLSKIEKGNWNSVPEELRGVAQMIADYKYPKLTGMALRSPYFRNMFNIISKVDPSFNALQYDARQKTLNDFASGGKSGQNITSFNTAAHHLGRALDNSEIMSNKMQMGDSWLLNKGNIAGAYVFGHKTEGLKAYNTYRSDVNALQNEVERATSGAAPHVAGKKGWEAVYDPALPKDVRTGALVESLALMRDRLDEVKQAYRRSFGEDPKFSLISPSAERLMIQHGLGDMVKEYGSDGGKKPYLDPAGIQPAAEVGAPKGTPDDLIEVTDSQGNVYGLTPDNKVVPLRK